MNEYEAKLLLKKYGINVPRGVVLNDLGEIESIDLHYPLVAKVAREDILHKSDVGGVILNIENRNELIKVFKSLRDKFASPVLVEEMVKDGVEVIVGVIKDLTFGHAIMFGLGGIFTEIYKDVTFRVLPINRRDAEWMLDEIKGKKILEGYRGIKINKDKIADLLMKVSQLVGENPWIEGMDLNPVLARSDGCVVLDAKIVGNEL